MLTSLLFQTLGMESVNVVVKVNDLDIFLDTLKKIILKWLKIML